MKNHSLLKCTFFCVALLFAVSVHAMDNTYDLKMTGSAVGDELGDSVSATGDVNGDGYDDMIVGAGAASNGSDASGMVYIYFGGATPNNVADITLSGEVAGDYFGLSVVSGDVNDDGYDDVVVGAPWGGDYANGRVYLFYGGSSMDTTADVIFNAESTESLDEEQFGYSVDARGDVNGDGFNDIVVGVPNRGGFGFYKYGQAQIFFGGSTIDNVKDVQLDSIEAKYNLGYSVSNGGDLNGDGYDDVAVGAPKIFSSNTNHQGATSIYLGNATMSGNLQPDLNASGIIIADYFGMAVSIVGDLNNDGYDDLVAGASGAYTRGRANVFLGGSSMNMVSDLTINGSNDGDLLGNAISPANDVNKDGFDDFLVGAWCAAGGGSCRGEAYLFYGGSSLDANADITFFGENDDDSLGTSVSAGDVDNDNEIDAIIGAPYYIGNDMTGAAYVYYGSVPTVSPTVSTVAVSDIAENTATGNGSVTATGGENPTRYIQWGTTAGVYTDNCNASSGGTGDYSCAMTGLSPGTTYYVQAYATNGTGTGYGSETSFTTLSSGDDEDDDDSPTKPHIKEISDITDNSLVVEIEVDPSYAGQELDFEIKIKNKDEDETDIEKITKRADENGKISIKIDDLDEHTDYSINVRFSPGGQENYSDYSETESVQTERDITDDEKCMTNNLKAEKVSGGVKLSWDETCEDINGILIERKIDEGEFKQIDSIDEDKNSFVDEDVDKYGEYTYRTRGYKGDKYTEYSDEVSVDYLLISHEDGDSSGQEVADSQTPTSGSETIGAVNDADQNQPQEVAMQEESDIFAINNSESDKDENKNKSKEDSQSSALSFALAKAKEIANEFSTELASLAFAGLAAGVAIAGASSAVPLLATSAEPFRGGMFRLFGIIGIITNKKKKFDDWGTVFDSETKQPISGVVISLINESGHVADTVVSDSQGRYGFLPNPGKYTMRISRQNYTFDRSERESSLYGDLYTGEEIAVTEGQVEKMSIALCSTAINWKDFARRKIAAYTSVFSIIKRDFFIVIFYAGFIISGGIVCMFTTPLNVVIFAVYVCLLAYQLFFKRRSYGMITHAQTGKPVPFAMVAIYNERDPERRVAFAVSDVLGRYYMLAEKGTYQVKISGNLLGGERFEKIVRTEVTDGIVKVDVTV